MDGPVPPFSSKRRDALQRVCDSLSKSLRTSAIEICTLTQFPVVLS